jgi:type IV secretory pathway VirB9-like protein
MKALLTRPSVAAVLTCTVLQSACAAPPVADGTIYDFDWRISGAAEVRPFQVFDDGQKLYLQFDDPKHVPAILADTPGGQVLLDWRPQPPYIIIDRMERALVFRAGSWEASAVRASTDRAPRSARFATAKPAEVTHATTTPAKSNPGPLELETSPPAPR